MDAKSTPYLTPTQVAERLGLKLRAVQRYCAAGLFPGSIQVGRSWGIPPAAIDRFQPPRQGNPAMGPGFWTERRRKALKKTLKNKSKKSLKD